ncbi:MAG: DNA repair protein RecN [Flavobacteriaceae bacterium]|nr:DNA repair protein RecN [Flavobacteriaceae bacterium]
MLQQLSIKNFALIDDLKVNFNEGFSIITGETGAGKSIILGALSLILGKRADLSLLKSSESKCIIEGEFGLQEYQLESFFEDYDLEYDTNTIIRREIYPSGKSRAFINDTPVTLNILNDLSVKLIDIHSQHETLQLADTNFQFQIIDALAENIEFIDRYKKTLKHYNQLNSEFNELLRQQQEAKLQYDYNLFLLTELNEADLKVAEQEELENTLDKLNNIEAIKQHFIEAISLADQDEIGIKMLLNKFKQNLLKLASFSEDYGELLDRITSLDIEFNDIVDDLKRGNESVSRSPQEIDNYNERLQLIYNLQKKHSVTTNEELLDIQARLSVKVDTVENATEILDAKKEELDKVEIKLNELADSIHNNREKILPDLVKKLENSLDRLSMPNTKFKIEISKSEDYLSNGKDHLRFLVSANKGSSFEPLKKVASGGEMSRIMLAVKALLSEYSRLATIIFDEIDTGVSGEVSNKIATVMSEMSKNMQVIAITHLPQIAAKGTYHYKVYKKDSQEQTVTNIKELNAEERIHELAEMLSGKKLVTSAIEHAKQLLS